MHLKNLFRHWTYQIFAPGTVVREKYEAFKELLANDRRSHELISELEFLYYDQKTVDLYYLERLCDELSGSVSKMIECLLKMAPIPYVNLRDYYKKIDFYIHYILAPPEYDFSPPFTMTLEEIGSKEHRQVGGKAFHLAIVGKKLGMCVPKGFVITTNAFYYFLEYNNLKTQIAKQLSRLDLSSTALLDRVSNKLTSLIMDSKVPPDLEEAILTALDKLKQGSRRESLQVAVRSSAAEEDDRSSFAGQYLSVLDVGREQIIDAYKQVLASKYSPRALYYRINAGFSDLETPMAVLVLEMIDPVASGVVYTSDPRRTNPELLTVHSIWGLGELLVSGKVSPDKIEIKKGPYPTVVGVKVRTKTKKLVRKQGGKGTMLVPVEEKLQQCLSITEQEAVTLCRFGMQIESYFKCPQDIEWCKTEQGQIVILQTRPLVIRQEKPGQKAGESLGIELPVLMEGGETASSGIGTGKVYMPIDGSDLEDVPEDSVLVIRDTSPHYVKILGRIKAVVADSGSVAGHFASVAREFKVPCLVATEVATKVLTPGLKVTVDADNKVVYKGIIQQELASASGLDKRKKKDSPYFRRLEYILKFISTLNLVDPLSKEFVPESCRTFHDIVRFCHEKALYEMFSLGDRRSGRIREARKLVSDLPVLFYVLDVGRGLKEEATGKGKVTIEEIHSLPFRALWKGLTHPSIDWVDTTHFDWQQADAIYLAGGIVNKDSQLFASYAVISDEYLNLNMRFGYHFVILDIMCTNDLKKNHILFRFSGGGGDFQGRLLRANFLSKVLGKLGFHVEIKGDVVDAKLLGGKKEDMMRTIETLGRLLGVTKLMDMYLKDESMVDRYVQDFIEVDNPSGSVRDTR